MLELLTDIRQRLVKKEYHNEEHVRLSLVARVVQECGWNVWNPTEVYTEFKATIKEDNTRVDMALFTHDFEGTAIFIECKAVGAFSLDLSAVERQLRDYNRDHTALFTIITDGRHWRFYFSFTSGEFKDKLFCKFDLQQDGLEEVGAYLETFLNREHILNQSARQKAEAYLMLGKKDRAMQDVLLDAQKMVSLPPFPSLPQAIVQLLAAKSLTITSDEAQAFLTGAAPVKPLLLAAAPAAQVAAAPPKPGATPAAPIVPGATAGLAIECEFFLVLKRAGVKAVGDWEADARRLTVRVGSTAMLATGSSLGPNNKVLRKKLISQKVLIEQDGLLVFQKPYTFESLTQAAATVCGYSVNGKQAWRNATGKPLADYLESIR